MSSRKRHSRRGSGQGGKRVRETQRERERETERGLLMKGTQSERRKERRNTVGAHARNTVGEAVARGQKSKRDTKRERERERDRERMSSEGTQSEKHIVT